MENLMNLPITAVIGPPPANVDLKQNRTWRDNAAVITISGIAVITVVIRFIVRFRSQKARPVLDEWLIAVTLIPMLALLAASLAGGHYGMGKHVWLVTFGAMVKMKKKIMITSVFFIGVFVCIASIVRLHYLTCLKGTLDITWVMSDVYVWSTVEPCLGIICACLPALQPLVQSFMKAEHLLYLQKRLRRSKRMSQVNQLRKRISNTSSSNNSHSRSDTMDSLDGKPELGLRAYDDEVHLTSCVAQVESERGRKERENLEEFLGPMFIRVEHEVEWTVDHS
ncbi:hypothetical protein PoHVEF18_004939 [Penicillium ochrochloron]